MSSFDVRSDVGSSITEIVFSEDVMNGCDVVYKLVEDDYGFTLCDNIDTMYVTSKMDALNMIKAIQKAIELGWVK